MPGTPRFLLFGDIYILCLRGEHICRAYIHVYVRVIMFHDFHLYCSYVNVHTCISFSYDYYVYTVVLYIKKISSIYRHDIIKIFYIRMSFCFMIIFIFQLREYPCNTTHDIYIFLYTTDIFRTKNHIPRIFLEYGYIFCG